MAHLLEEIELADRVGLASYGIGEHHRVEYYDAAPAVILACGCPKRCAHPLTWRFLGGCRPA